MVGIRENQVEAGHMVSQMVDLMVKFMEGRKVNQVDQDLNRKWLEDQAEADLTLRHMDHKAKLVDQDLNRKWLEGLAEVALMENRAARAGRVDLLANNLIIKITKEGKAKSFPLFSLMGTKFSLLLQNYFHYG